MSMSEIAMPLSVLCREAGSACPAGSGNLLIRGVTCDSRRVKPGYLFAALPGLRRNGTEFVSEAAARGAAAVLLPSGSGEVSLPSGIVRLTADDARAAVSYLLDAWYGHPGRRLRLVGITGTNGKTSVCCMLTHILRYAGVCAGSIGTPGYSLPDGIREADGDRICPADSLATMTTPDPEELYAILARMADAGQGSELPTVVMEVSSHALALEKVRPLHFAVGIFTNLSSEHMDFHGTMENYYQAKRRLFRQADVGIVNGDDAYGLRLPADEAAVGKWPVCRSGLSGVTSGAVPGRCTERYRAEQVKNRGLDGVEYGLVSPGARMRVVCPVPGEFTVMNSLEAAAAALTLGVSPTAVKNALACFPGVPGRVERVPVEADFSVFIDYAHTPDALEKLLLSFHRIRGALPQERRGRLVLLFGCGGDRDREKRRSMARIASAMADAVVITSDNSRSEEPEAIIAEILKGIDKESEYCVIPDRAEAIRRTVKSARAGDILLLCGKGHEMYEIDRTGRHPFDERRIVREAIEGR